MSIALPSANIDCISNSDFCFRTVASRCRLSCPYSETADRRHRPHRQNSARSHLPALFHAPAHSPAPVCGGCRLSSCGRPLPPCGHPHPHQRRPAPEQPVGAAGACPVHRGLSVPRQAFFLSDTAPLPRLCLQQDGRLLRLCRLPGGCDPVTVLLPLSPRAGVPPVVSPGAAFPLEQRALPPCGFSPGADGSSSDQSHRSPHPRAADSKQAR